jgi:hypothetical protein
MKWQKVGSSYLLTSDTEELIRLQYDVTQASVFEMNGGVYTVSKKGFWNQRYHIAKKGFEVGMVSHNFWGSKGAIRFVDGTNYNSDYKYKNVLTLRFMDGESEILNYGVGGEPGKQFAVFSLGIAMIDADKLLIMAALGMIMFLDIFNEFNEAGDDGGLTMIMLP